MGTSGRDGHRLARRGDERERIKALERGVCELCQANEILRKAFAYFAPLSAMLRIACRAVGQSSTAH
ncbi:MAG: hypothetical protein GY761_17510 [Hyphomicrobiales bacterium]|nr:hypothetical protein [Hyphomicrobiales bacterium]